MVSIITCHLKRWQLLSCIAATCSLSLQGNWLDDAWNSVKDAANTVDKAFQDAGREIGKTAVAIGEGIKDRFKDTKTTRAIDYGIRKAALETALATATGVLEASKQISTGTLVAAEETGKAGLSAAEHFLSDVVRAVSPQILKGSAQAAQGSLEVVKKAGVGTLQGTQWIVNQVADLFDINRIRYQGDLKRLEHGVLGDVLCEGTAFKKPFSAHFDLDPRDLKSVQKSIETLLKDFERLFNENVANPIQKAFAPLQQQVQSAEKMLALQAPANPAITQAAQISEQAAAIEVKVMTAEQHMTIVLKHSEEQLRNVAAKKTEELEALVRQGVTRPSPISALARQELVKRLKQK